MKTVIKLLKRELGEWQDKYREDKEFFAGAEKEKYPKSELRKSEIHISELKQAIQILLK